MKMNQILNSKMQQYRPAIEAEMRAVLRSNGAHPNLFEGMMHYHMGWVNAEMGAERSKSGKQIRPILTLLCCEAAGGDWQQAIPAAASLEILHNFTLVHDDIEDGSPLRRGRPTVWQIWGEPQAINAGDAMFASAQLAMARLAERGVDPTVVVTALRRLNEMCIDLTRGQFSDMSFETRDDVTVDEYLAMIEGKTAVLLSLAAELGARVAGADEETVAHYAQFGLDLGLAFQVCDDILGIWGDEETIGKSAESDIATKKKTLPVLYGLGKSVELRTHYEGAVETPNFVPDAINLLDQCEARTYSEQYANRYSNSALNHLTAAQPQGTAATALDELAYLLLHRDS